MVNEVVSSVVSNLGTIIPAAVVLGGGMSILATGYVKASPDTLQGLSLRILIQSK